MTARSIRRKVKGTSVQHERTLNARPRAGQNLITVQGTMPRDAACTQTRCADEQGFGLHEAVRCGADERQRLDCSGTHGKHGMPHAVSLLRAAVCLLMADIEPLKPTTTGG